MKKFLTTLLALCCAVTLTYCGALRAPAAESPAPKARAKYVILISLDGGKPSVMQSSKMPILFDMVARGAGTWQAQTVFPSITLVAHTSMLTGVTPVRHGITWNDWEPDKGLVKVTTMFEQAHQRGFTTAMFVGKEKFRHLALPGTVDKFDWPATDALKVANATAVYFKSNKPNLTFVHMPDSDLAGHNFGWGSPEQIASFAVEDTAIGTIKQAVADAGAAADTVIIVSADHGGTGRGHGSNSPEDMTIPWIASGGPTRAGFTIKAPVNTMDSAATALWLLGVPVPADWDGKPVTSAFR